MSQPVITQPRKLATPDAILGKLLSLFAPANRRAAFLSALVGGLLCHLYILTNMLPEHDWQYNFYADQSKVMLGRWLLKWACAPSSNAILSWFTGLLVLFYLALAAVLVVDLLDIRSPALAGLAGLLMVTMPSVASGFAYMFTADGYFLSVLLAVAAARLACCRRKVPGTLLAALALGCSMGIYQAYAGVTLLLFCSVLILRLLRDQPSFRAFFVDALPMILSGILGVLFYFVMLYLSLARSGQTLADYQGISALGGGSELSIAVLLNRLYLLFSAWREGARYLFFEFPALGNSVWGQRFVWIMYLLLALLLLGCVWAQRLWRRPWALPVLALILVLIPLGTNYVEVLTSEVSSHLLMRYSLTVPFLLVLALTQLLLDSRDAFLPLRQAAAIAVPLAALGLCLSWTVLVNAGYTHMEYQYERVYSNMVRMADRIQQTEGYYAGIPVMISNSYAETLIEGDQIDTSGLTGLGGIVQYDAYHYISFLRTWCGLDIQGCEPETAGQIWGTEEFQDMPAWPESGCTQVIDGVLVVKTAPTE